ncbi:MAG: hypothetical protein R3C99_26010 [Pirellulaceae bacterium]
MPTSWLLLVAIGAVAVGVGMLSASPLAGAAVWFAMIVSLWRLWLPVRFEIGPRGLAQQVLGWRRLIVWRNIPRVEVRPQELCFMPVLNPSRFALLPVFTFAMVVIANRFSASSNLCGQRNSARQQHDRTVIVAASG